VVEDLVNLQKELVMKANICTSEEAVSKLICLDQTI